MEKFECNCICDNEDCSGYHNPPRPPCNCIRQLSKSTKFIHRLLDCAETIVRVLCICGIHECKAKAAAEVIVYGFLHYDIVPDPVNDVLRKKLRKEDVFHDLGRKCRLNRTEAHLAYAIIKKAFKAFYYKQSADSYNPDYIDEMQWMRAAQKSAEVRAIAEGLTEPEKKRLENRIKCAYCSFVQRIEEIARKDGEKTCTCCFCSKCHKFGGKDYKIYSKYLPEEDDQAFKFKKRLIEEGKLIAKAIPDPCGIQILERQTRLKNTTVCMCGGDPCCCQPIADCNCEEVPCICGATDISVQWGPDMTERTLSGAVEDEDLICEDLGEGPMTP